MVDFVDAKGTEIKVGDQLVWSHIWGRSSARLARGVVIGFTKQKIKFVNIALLKRYDLPSHLTVHTNINPGFSVLVVNNEQWDDIDYYRATGILPERAGV